MSLSEEQIVELRKKYNVGILPQKTSAPVTKVEDRIAGLKAQPSVFEQKGIVNQTTQIQPEQTPEQDGFLGRTFDRQKEVATTGKEAIGRQLSGEQGTTATIRQTLGKAAGEGAETAFDALFSTAKNVGKLLLPKKAEEAVAENFSSIFQTEPAKKVLSAIESGEEKYNAFKQQNPQIAAEVEAILGFSELAGLQPASKVISASKTVQKIQESSRIAKTAKNIKKIEDVIKPKMTKKQVQIALDEGRVIRTSKAQKFFGKKDVQLADGRVKSAARTVVEEIPDANFLDDAQLVNQAKEKISVIAKQVEPKLREIKLSSSSKEEILSSYIKKLGDNIDNYPLLTKNQVKNLNKRFEDVLLELGEANNVDDLWKAVQKYDKSVSKNVKAANDVSTESLQLQKDIWLENRRILRDALDDIVDGVDENVAKDFRKMRDLYLVRENIINNAEFFKGSGNLTKALLRAGLTSGVVSAGTAAGFMLLD